MTRRQLDRAGLGARTRRRGTRRLLLAGGCLVIVAVLLIMRDAREARPARPAGHPDMTPEFFRKPIAAFQEATPAVRAAVGREWAIDDQEAAAIESFLLSLTGAQIDDLTRDNRMSASQLTATQRGLLCQAIFVSARCAQHGLTQGELQLTDPVGYVRVMGADYWPALDLSARVPRRITEYAPDGVVRAVINLPYPQWTRVPTPGRR